MSKRDLVEGELDEGVTHLGMDRAAKKALEALHARADEDEQAWLDGLADMSRLCVLAMRRYARNKRLKETLTESDDMIHQVADEWIIAGGSLEKWERTLASRHDAESSAELAPDKVARWHTTRSWHVQSPEHEFYVHFTVDPRKVACTDSRKIARTVDQLKALVELEANLVIVEDASGLEQGRKILRLGPAPKVVPVQMPTSFGFSPEQKALITAIDAETLAMEGWGYLGSDAMYPTFDQFVATAITAEAHYAERNPARVKGMGGGRAKGLDIEEARGGRDSKARARFPQVSAVLIG